MNAEIRVFMGDRLRQEREGLGLPQSEMAALGGAKPRTYQDWERGVAAVSAEFLAVVASVGVDVLYVVTGKRDGGAALSASENELLARLRQGSPVLRGYLQEVGQGFASVGSTVSIGGDVGQQVNGDQTVSGPLTFNLVRKAKK